MTDRIDALYRLDRATRWTRTEEVPIDGDSGHPQGLTRWGDNWLVTTVHPDRERGEVLVVAVDSTVHERIAITRGPCFHPGGIDATKDGCFIALAEYRPDSTTRILHLGPELELSEVCGFDDHLGFIAHPNSDQLIAGSWGSRRFYRLDTEGQVLDAAPNPSHVVDHQDATVIDGLVAATGVGGIHTPSGRLQLGGLALVDPDLLSVDHETLVAAWEPSGRVATYNGAHTEVGPDGTVQLTCVVDDTNACLATWVTESR